MPISWRDSLASLFVVLAVVVYAAWAMGAAVPGFTEVGAVAIAVLVLGVAASASAVVPGWDALVHGSRTYFGAASVLGAVALVAGVWSIVAGEAVALAVLVLATVVLWVMSTMRHVRVDQPGHRLQPR